MSFFAILFALLLEQVRPLARHNPIHAALRSWARWASRNFDAGKTHHGWVAWTVAVILPSAAAAGVYWLLALTLGWPLAVLWSVAVLYVTLGFRQFSHHFTSIRDALDAGDEAAARELLAQWQQVDAGELPRSEIVRHVIEYSVLAAHRHVFGVLAWFSVLAAFGLGPAGAILYRMSEFVARYWKYRNQTQTQPSSVALQSAAARAWAAIDWLPARITALAFAVVGSFEEAIDCWRNYAQRFPNDNDGVILAATSGAVNVRLGGEALKSAYPAGATQAMDDTESTPGREAEVGHLRSIVGLVWRSVVLWMVLLALLTLARLLG
jgi:adenosylcobinamide-phosphate synthase